MSFFLMTKVMRKIFRHRERKLNERYKMDVLTAIIPCYNEQEVLPLFYREVKRVAEEMRELIEFEFLFVDDGSSDGTLSILRKLAEEDLQVHYLSFSRNFGKEAAMLAGLENAAGNYVAILDADLQDPPALLPEMLHAIRTEGYDSVATRRLSRKGEPPIRSFFARMFYRIINRISKTDVVDGARDFRLMNRKFVDALLQLKEYNRFSKGLFGWVGMKTKWIAYDNIERADGTTKWSFCKLFLYALDGILAFSTVPLALSSIMGLFFCLLSLVMVVFIIIKTLVFGDPVGGWPSMVCTMMLLGGVQLFVIGILGKYLAKIYLEVKHRPSYFISETEHS